jgi:formamidopyrimidine-DNA glycosylase
MRMAGNFSYEEKGAANNKYALVEFFFDNGYQLNFDDFRKFATCTLYEGYDN